MLIITEQSSSLKLFVFFSVSLFFASLSFLRTATKDKLFLFFFKDCDSNLLRKRFTYIQFLHSNIEKQIRSLFRKTMVFIFIEYKGPTSLCSYSAHIYICRVSIIKKMVSKNHVIIHVLSENNISSTDLKNIKLVCRDF